MNKRFCCLDPRVLKKQNGASSNISPLPSTDQITEYCNGVLGVPGDYSLEDPAVRRWQEEVRNIPTPAWEEPDLAVRMSALRNSSSWKAPGRDGLCTFWWKVFHRTNGFLWRTVRDVLKTDLELPAWFVKGRTVLIPKPGCVRKPDQYRPITCLNTGYKLLTPVITTLLRQHVDKHSIFPAEQRALQKEKCGCLDALLVDSIVNEEVCHRRKKLSVA